MRGAIFDMDGTLLDTEKHYRQAWIEMSERWGLDRGEEMSAAISGTTLSLIPEIIHRFHPTIDEHKFFEQTMARVRELDETDLEVKSGVRETLERLRSWGVKMAIASSATLEMIEKNMIRVGLEKYFEAYTSGSEVERGKPAPDIFVLAAQRLGLEPTECYVFEDSFNGVRAGRAAGSRTIMIIDQVEPTDEIRSMADGVYNSFDEWLRAEEERDCRR